MSGNDSPAEPEALLRYFMNEAVDGVNREVMEAVVVEPVEILQERFSDEVSHDVLWADLQAERNAFPDLTHEIHEVWQDGDMLFAEYTASGTFTGELALAEDAVFEGDGQDAEIHGLIKVRIEDGKITGWGYHAEMLPFFQDMGIVPPFSELAD